MKLENHVWRGLAIMSAGACFAAFPGSPSAQTLNEAVTEQLAVDSNLIACGVLLAGDPESVLGSSGDALFDICDRSVNQAGVPPSTSGGGGAGTAVSTPHAVQLRLNDEGDDEDPVLRGVFFSLEFTSLDRSVTEFEDGYASDVLRFTAGYDRSFGTAWVAGLALEASQQDGDFSGSGDFEVSSVGVTAFASYLFGETGSLDVYGGFASLSNDRQRSATFRETPDPALPPFEVIGNPTADYDAGLVQAGVQIAFDWTLDNVTLGPRIGYDWSNTDYDTYSEMDTSGLGLTFHDDEEGSSQFFAGLTGSVNLSTEFGVVVFQQSIMWRNESDQDQRLVEVSFADDPRARRFTYQTETPDRKFFEIDAGVIFVLPSGWQWIVNYHGVSSHSFVNSNGWTLGVRKDL